MIHAGEYHFPLLDAVNNVFGGPNVTLLNRANANGKSYTVGFYDDRDYRTLGGYNVTKSSVSASGSAADVGQPLGGINPPSIINADPVNGFDMSSAQRAYGQTGSNGNTSVPSAGLFGDTKGLDLWTFFPSPTAASTLNVQGPPRILLVERITAVNGADTTGFDDDPGTTDDNSPYWPSPAATCLRGVRSVVNVKPGDELEYTVYFVDTDGPGANILPGDVLPASTTFEATAYDGLTPTDGVAAGADSGIARALSASALPTAPTGYLSDVADADRGQFYAPGAAVPAGANPSGQTNTSGVVAVTLAPAPATLPSATGPGTPAGSYGFIRFRVRVK